MADVERVTTGLRYCSEHPEWNCDKQCPYGENGKKEAGACWVELNRDALSVIDGLKAELAELKARHVTIVKAADDMYSELKERRRIPVSEQLPEDGSDPDREKVIDFLQHISLNAYEYSDANYEVLGYPYLEAERIADDALALLKEQEAVKPTWSRGKSFCGACGLQIHGGGGKFCSECGKPILWEGR